MAGSPFSHRPLADDVRRVIGNRRWFQRAASLDPRFPKRTEPKAVTPARPIPAASSATVRGLAAEHLIAVERWVLWLSAALILGSLVTRNPRTELGALCGAGMSLLNARLLSALGRWANRGGPETARRRLSLVLVLFQLKLGLLAALIYLTVRYLPVAPLWLLLGLSLLPLGILIRAIEHRPSSATASPSAEAASEEGERAMHNHG